MSLTPLSDLMNEHQNTPNDQCFARFFEEFRRSKLGVSVTGSPAGSVGDVVSTSANPIKIFTTSAGDGQRRLLVFADPPAFAQRFGKQFNAEMDGEDLLEIAASIPDYDGILVNNATKEHAIIIDRESIISKLGLQKASRNSERKPWWRRW